MVQRRVVDHISRSDRLLIFESTYDYIDLLGAFTRNRTALFKRENYGISAK